MEEFKGTKGKWKVDFKNQIRITTTVHGYIHDIAQIDVNINDYTKNENRANAQLIAAAPELLEALQESNELIEWLFDNGGYTGMETAYNRTINQMNDNQKAINKALGL